MKCRDLQENLALYVDELLDVKSYADLDKHLSVCSSCRQKLEEFQSLQFNLRTLSRPQIPSDLAFNLQSAVSLDTFEFLKFKVMPFTVATFASLLLSISLLYVLLSSKNNIENQTLIVQNTPSKIMLTPLSSNENVSTKTNTYSSKNYVPTSLAISGESPTINPSSALISLTKSMAGGQMKDSEVVVVADVFSNGLAKISQVIEAPSNKKTLDDLEKALSSDPDFAPFVPSEVDKRSDNLRIVLRIQSVNVNTNSTKRR
jgi:hypothetical protein